MLSNLYVTEVLGVTNYICPSSVRALRCLKGRLPCRFLVVVFDSLSVSQKALLKKIMLSLQVFEYSLLEVREEKILEELFEKADSFAQFVFIIGGKNFVQAGKLTQSKGQLVSALGNKTHCSFFQSACSLEELEGSSPAVREKKQQLWNQLQLWKNTSQF